jgi:glucosamine kinase
MDAGVGLAGIGRRGILDEIYARRQPFRSVVYVNDTVIACMGAHSGRDGGIVIIGTGSAAFAMVRGREVKAGGYGFPVSDEGSGADLGLRAIRLALRAHDGRIPATRLTAEVMDRFDGDPFAAVAWMDCATATDYATLAPLVMRHADAGDPAGRRIVCAAAEEIDTMVRRLIESGAPRIALTGGLAVPMEPWLAPDVRRRLSPAEGDALAGALLLARQQGRAAARRMG